MGIDGVSHVTLSTANVEAASSFYSNVLGFGVVATWPKGAYLVGGDLWLALVAGPPETRSGDYSHIAFHVDQHRFEELSKSIVRDGAGQWQENWTEGDSLYFVDPDGHQLEIHSTTLSSRIESAIAEPWDGLSISDDALDRARLSPSVPDPRKPRRLACAPVGVFVVVVDDQDRVLILRHPDSGRIEVPNGAMEPGEDPAATALRELREEAGSSLSVGPMRCHSAFNVEYHPHLPPLLSLGFVCTYRGGELAAGDDMTGWLAGWTAVTDIDEQDLKVPASPETLLEAISVLHAHD